MRILIDTNILISAALNPSGTPFAAFQKAVTYPNQGVVCDQNIDEMRRIFNRKFPAKISALETFLSSALLTLEVVQTPIKEDIQEEKIRDVNDRPILRAAICAKTDILLTGDKDFLDSNIHHPVAMSASDFLALPSTI